MSTALTPLVTRLLVLLLTLGPLLGPLAVTARPMPAKDSVRDLEKKITKLVFEGRQIIFCNRICNLVGLLDGIG